MNISELLSKNVLKDLPAGNPWPRYSKQEAKRLKKARDDVIKQLYDAVINDDVKTIESFISQGFDVNWKSDNLNTLLHHAACRNSGGVLSLLLTAGANFNLKNKQEMTALELAIAYGKLKNSRILIEAGADFRTKSKLGITALHLAIKRNDSSILQYFLQHGADANLIINKSNQTFLHELALNFNPVISPVKLAEVLLRNGAKVNVFDCSGYTPLHYAIRAGSKDLVQILLKNNANLNLKNCFNETPLLCAIQFQNSEIVELLVNKGSDINIIDQSVYRTPLNKACMKENMKIIECLINNGANVNEPDANKNSPLFNLLINNSYCPNTLEVLLTQGANYNVTDVHGRSPLQILLENNIFKPKYLELLLDCGIDVNIRDRRGKTPIQSLISRYCEWEYGDSIEDFVKVIESFLKNGVADIDATDENGHTCLLRILCSSSISGTEEEHTVIPFCHYSDSSPHLRLLELFLKYGADISIIDEKIRNIFFLIPTEFFWTVILKHLAVLKEFKMNTNLLLMEIILSEAIYNNYFARCTRELAKAKNIKLDSLVTVFNLLTDHKSKLVKYVENKNLVKDLNKINLEKEFQIYGSEIKSRYTEAVGMQELYNHAANSFSNRLPIFGPMHSIIKDVAYCLTIKQLIKFCK